jgi:hypothetical protein
MACLFNTPGCAGPRTAQNECAYCQEITKDDELFMMASIFPPDHVRKLVEPRVAQTNRARTPMPAVPIAGGKHVNKATVAGPSFELSALTRSAGDQNCALCACAGCVNLAVGYVKFTTKKVAKLHGVDDGYKALGKREEQEQKIILFVTSHLPGYQLFVHGSDANRMDLQTALATMKVYPDETVFVISTTGGISKGGIELSKTSWGHWLNAVKKNGDIMFVDFQTDHEQRLGRGFVSSQPILGNFGVEWDNPRMQVIALVPPPPRPTQLLPPVQTLAQPQPQPNTTTTTTTTTTTPLRTSGGHTPLDAGTTILTPVLPTVTTQQVVPLAIPQWQGPSRRQLRGRGVNYGTAEELDDKFKRQGRLLNKYH